MRFTTTQFISGVVASCPTWYDHYIPTLAMAVAVRYKRPRRVPAVQS